MQRTEGTGSCWNQESSAPCIPGAAILRKLEFGLDLEIQSTQLTWAILEGGWAKKKKHFPKRGGGNQLETLQVQLLRFLPGACRQVVFLCSSREFSQGTFCLGAEAWSYHLCTVFFSTSFIVQGSQQTFCTDLSSREESFLAMQTTF